jgi:membrane fusion protein, multidrug efflux system
MNRTLLASLIILSSTLAISACGRKEAPAAPERPVKLLTVGESQIGAATEFAGEVRARIESDLGFRVGGKIITRLVETGQRVRKGQELARLDPRDFQLSDQAASAQLIAAKAQLENARSEFKRYEELARKGYVSQTDLDRKRVELSAAEAQHDSATSGMSLEKNRLVDTSLRADVDGVVTAVEADVGEVVSAGQPVIRLAQDGAREIEVEFPEDRTQLAKIAKAEVRLWARPGTAYTATLRELAAAADPVTRTFRARYTVKAPADAMALGQSATLKLRLPAVNSGAARLPTTAIFGKQNQTLVWIYDSQKEQVHQQAVKIAGADGNDVLVAGLKPGQQVVIAGVHVLSEGQKVKPYTPVVAH